MNTTVRLLDFDRDRSIIAYNIQIIDVNIGFESFSQPLQNKDLKDEIER